MTGIDPNSPVVTEAILAQQRRVLDRLRLDLPGELTDEKTATWLATVIANPEMRADMAAALEAALAEHFRQQGPIGAVGGMLGIGGGK